MEEKKFTKVLTNSHFDRQSRDCVLTMDSVDKDSCDEDLTEEHLSSGTHPLSEAHRSLPTVSLPGLNVDLRAEILKAVRDAARAQEQSLHVTIESMKRELEKTTRSRQEERQRKLALLLEGRQMRVTQMEKWKEEKKDISHRRSEGHNEEGAECAAAVLKEAICHLPRVIHTLDHLRSVEIEELNKREEEEDCAELEAWKKQHSHLATIIKEQNRETVARVAHLWKLTMEGENGMCKKTSAVTLAVPSKLPPLTSQLPSKLPPLSSQLPSKLPPLTSQLPSKLPPLPSKLPQLPAKLPPLNLPVRKALCTVAPLPPIQSKTEQEDLDLESISDLSTQSAVAEHLVLNLDADGQSPEVTSARSSEFPAAGDSAVKQERKKRRSIKERFFQFFKKLNCCSAKED